MKPSRLLTLIVFAVATLAHAQAPAPTPAPSADADWQAFQAVVKEAPPKPLNELSPLERAQVIEKHYADLRTAALAFIEKNPADPRRWSAVMQLSPTMPRFVKEWGTDDKGNPKPVIDEAAAAVWKTRVEELKAAMAKATDLPADVRDQLAMQEAVKPFMAAMTAQRNGGKVDLAELRAKLDGFAAKNPTATTGGTLAYYYMNLVEKVAPDRVEAEWASLTGSPNKAIAEMATNKSGATALLKKPLEIAFTAVDGRAVDLKNLRGKVVLVDFWATWCGPCVAELPNVKKVYAAYHDKGFEIVGISLDREGDKQKLIDFTAKENMPWPQYFDGKYWKNEISTRFAINSIPAMFLLDQDGKVVSTNARGEALEREVKRLLKL